jgi:hypothetical protein
MPGLPGRGVEQAPQFPGRKHRGQPPGPLGAGQLVKPLVAAQRHPVEKLQRAAGLVVEAPTDLALLHQVKQVLANLLAAELRRRASVVSGKVGHGPHVGLDRVLREIAQANVFDQPFSKGCHRSLLVREAIHDAGRRATPRFEQNCERDGYRVPHRAAV